MKVFDCRCRKVYLFLALPFASRAFVPCFSLRKRAASGISRNILQIPSGAREMSGKIMMSTDGETYDAFEEGRNHEEADDVVDEPVDNPEIVALKEEISDLESELKERKATLSYELERVEEYSKAGYARAVAEMENMRRVRSNMNSSNKSSAMAGVLRDFLPVYDKMNSLKEKYVDDEFGSKYGGLTMVPTFSKMGVKEFSVGKEEPVDGLRMQIVGSEFSGAEKNTVIQELRPGMELDGNIIRPAEVIASLGEEQSNDEGPDVDSSGKHGEE